MNRIQKGLLLTAVLLACVGYGYHELSEKTNLDSQNQLHASHDLQPDQHDALVVDADFGELNPAKEVDVELMNPRFYKKLNKKIHDLLKSASL